MKPVPPPPRPTEAPRRRLTGAIVPALAAASLAGAAAMMLAWPHGDGSRAGAGNLPFGCILNGLNSFGGPLSLTDQNGRAVTQASFAARPTVLYFGYTHCPDACPTALYALGQSLAAHNPHNVQAVFVTVDPERDTQAVLRDFARYNGFPAGLVGLTGTDAQVEAAKTAFGVRSRKAPVEGATDGSYTVDHTSLFYVMDSHWRPRGRMSTMGATPEAVTACLSAALGD